MSLWKIAWRSIQQRGLASALTTLSMALGVTLVVAVLSIHGVVTQSFRNNTTLGYDTIVGAKGGKLQLTLNTVYYLSSPVENIPYEYYLEFKPTDVRQEEMQNSLRYRARQAQWETARAQLAASGIGPQMLAAEIMLEAAQESDPMSADLTRTTRFGSFVALAVPVCLGDYYGRFRVVGTTPDFFDKLSFGEESDKRYTFAQGRNFQQYSPENGYFEAVVGAAVAREMKVKLGDRISPTHGDPEAGGEEHGTKFTVVGILKPSGTPNDRAVFVNMEGFYLMEDHAKPVAEADEDEAEEDGMESPEKGTRGDENAAIDGQAADNQDNEHSDEHHHASGDDRPAPLPVEQREVTAILLRMSSPIFGATIPNIINEGSDAQAVMPILEITNLLDMQVRPMQWLLLILTILICVISGVSILVSIYNSMSERRKEIAVMRALGAGRGTVMAIVLLESIMLALGGGAMGWIGGHALNASARPWVELQTGVSIGFFDLAPPINVLELLGGNGIIMVYPELLLIPGLIVLAVAVGFLPALSAYRTDVARSLGP